MSQSPSERNTTFQLKRALKAEDECRELQAKIMEMETAIAAARVQALEEAAKWLDFYDGTGMRRAEAIRALIVRSK